MPLQIIRRDITTMRVDAIVNPTNEKMVGYSGIDFLVHQKAGPRLDELCRELAPLELGFSKITPGFDLPCRYIIHTSGPSWEGGRCGERALLKSCYLESLKLAQSHHCETVAFPLISSGNYGYPKDQVLKHAVEIISEYLQTEEMTVFLCVYDPASYAFSRTLYTDITRFIDSRIADFPSQEASRSLYTDITQFIDSRVEDFLVSEKPSPCCESAALPMPRPKAAASLKDFLEEMDAGFADTLFAYIDKKGMTDVACYKKANVDKKTFSKIKCNPAYKPSKPTVLAFAIALKLDLEETQHLLSTVGMTLSRSSKFDLIIEYFVTQGIYDIYEINQALFEFDQVLLGC